MRFSNISLGLVLCSTLSLSACIDNRCEKIDKGAVRYTDGHTNASRTFYQSSNSDEPYLRFPAGRNFHLEHGLRSAPSDVSVFLSFDASGKPNSIAAGNEALIVVEDEYIEVRNLTCSEFYLRVTASIDTSAPYSAASQDASPAEQDARATDGDAAQADPAMHGMEAGARGGYDAAAQR